MKEQIAENVTMSLKKGYIELKIDLFGNSVGDVLACGHAKIGEKVVDIPAFNFFADGIKYALFLEFERGACPIYPKRGTCFENLSHDAIGNIRAKKLKRSTIIQMKTHYIKKDGSAAWGKHDFVQKGVFYEFELLLMASPKDSTIGISAELIEAEQKRKLLKTL